MTNKQQQPNPKHYIGPPNLKHNGTDEEARASGKHLMENLLLHYFMSDEHQNKSKAIRQQEIESVLYFYWKIPE